jgi:hypothetical protein
MPQKSFADLGFTPEEIKKLDAVKKGAGTGKQASGTIIATLLALLAKLGTDGPELVALIQDILAGLAVA